MTPTTLQLSRRIALAARTLVPAPALLFALAHNPAFAADPMAAVAHPSAAADAASQALLSQLQRAAWIADGSDAAPRVVYVFTDPNCPFCNRFWSDARPWVDAGKVQLRHLIVAVLTPTSAGKAAALYSSKDPASAFAAHEGANAPANARLMAAGHIQPLGDLGIKSLPHVPAAVQAMLDNNERLMASLHLDGTPGVVWTNANGVIQARAGVPPGELDNILLPLR
jgi:thiol:disulfide interchange protein DsbG